MNCEGHEFVLCPWFLAPLSARLPIWTGGAIHRAFDGIEDSQINGPLDRLHQVSQSPTVLGVATGLEPLNLGSLRFDEHGVLNIRISAESFPNGMDVTRRLKRRRNVRFGIGSTTCLELSDREVFVRLRNQVRDRDQRSLQILALAVVERYEDSLLNGHDPFGGWLLEIEFQQMHPLFDAALPSIAIAVLNRLVQLLLVPALVKGFQDRFRVDRFLPLQSLVVLGQTCMDCRPQSQPCSDGMTGYPQDSLEEVLQRTAEILGDRTVAPVGTNGRHDSSHSLRLGGKHDFPTQITADEPIPL